MATKNPAIKPEGASVEDTPAALPRPRLGASVLVKVPEGMQLINNETNALFAPGVETPQTVTTTTLKRLDDGDLILVG